MTDRMSVEAMRVEPAEERQPLKPYHEHSLLQDYSEWTVRSDVGTGTQPYPLRHSWWCNHCKVAIEGPPFEIGEYVVALEYSTRPRWRRWFVHMRSNYGAGRLDAPVFETPRKAEALKHARELERERVRLNSVVWK